MKRERGGVGTFALACLVGSIAPGCGRYQFADGAGDGGGGSSTFDPLAWPDFTNTSLPVPLTGATGPVELTLIATPATGTVVAEFRLDDGAWTGLSTTPIVVALGPAVALQFQVRGVIGESAFLTVTDHARGEALVDTILGTVGSLVTGAGAPADPFTAPGTAPATCAAFLAAYPEQAGQDGAYTLATVGGDLVAWCDMSSDGGGWTLVARVTATSTTHDQAAAVGALVEPSQDQPAKLADDFINQLGFSQARVSIDTVGTVYVMTDALDLSGTVVVNLPNAAATSLAGPYNTPFLTLPSCSSDCGVAFANVSFGARCGYRYYATTSVKRPGMGCAGNFGKPGAVWVR